MDKKRNMPENFDSRVSKKRRITDYFEHRESHHKIWQIAKKGQMQNLISRFPQLNEEIFVFLNYQTLVKCREVNESWYNAITNQRIYWLQIISKYTNSQEVYHKQWMKATEKTPFEILKKLAGLARVHCKKDHSRTGIFMRSPDEDMVEPELSLFHILASEGDIDLFKYVAGKVECKNILGTKKERWRKKKEFYPLHEAASKGNFNICKFIIDQADDKNPANDVGHTPFHTAANYRHNDSRYAYHQKDSTEIVGHFEICKLIFESTGFQNPSDNDGKTPLHFAASNGNFKICQMIIEKVDAPNPTSNFFPYTPLHIAAKNGYFEICKLIVEKLVDKNPRDVNGDTPLHRAASNDHFEICQLIIGGIVEKNPRGEIGYTPLHFAARNNNLEICKLIIGQIADKNPINNLGVTPLHYAAENDSLEICQLIIGGLEETNPSDNDGNTPLHCAVRNFNFEICKLLCQNSNNKNPKNDRGKTPLDLAFERKDPKIVYFLIGENNLQH